MINPEDLELFFSSKNELQITHDNQYLLNGIKIKPLDLIDSLTTLFQNNPKEGLTLYLNVNDNASYESYFFVQDEFKGARHELRNKIAQAKFSKEFEYLSYDQQKEIRISTPFYIKEAYNSNEQFLYDFFKKKNELPTN